MTPEKRREIARLGGKAAHEKGRAHQFTPNEAREAGRKGGLSVSKNRQHMAEIGRAGGKARGGGRPMPYMVGENGSSQRAEVFHFPEQTLQQLFAGMNFPASKAQLLEKAGERTITVRGQQRPLRELVEALAQDLFATVAQLGEVLDRVANQAA